MGFIARSFLFILQRALNRANKTVGVVKDSAAIVECWHIDHVRASADPLAVTLNM